MTLQKLTTTGGPAFATTWDEDFAEPDWRRLPAFADVTVGEWESAGWQRRSSVKNVQQLKAVFGDFLGDRLAGDIAADQQVAATMPLLVPPQMLNTMDEGDLESDPVRRYMLPALSERDSIWPSHPHSKRDSLHESEMWATEGLVHRYPAKALIELLSTCPQYCGHCTRMDLVGGDTSAVGKYHFQTRRRDRYALMLAYLRSRPSIRDVVLSGGDLANLPVPLLEGFVESLLEIEHIRSIRLASKSLIALPQLFLQAEVLAALGRIARLADARGVDISLQTHVNHAKQITPLAVRAVASCIDAGIREVRNQTVLLRGVNDSAEAVLELCQALLYRARITPYYLYLCDMIPNAEHWRLALHEGQALQRAIMGHLPGFATPRVVCDVPLLGKRWVDQVSEYDRERGISYWIRPDALSGRFEYYDPIFTLPESGRRWWLERGGLVAADD